MGQRETLGTYGRKTGSEIGSMTRKKLKLAAFAVLCLMIDHSNAAGFDCAKARTIVEKTICADDELSQFDDAMASSYRSALQKAGKDAAFVRRAQKEWLSERNRCADRGCFVASYAFRLWQLASPNPAHPSMPKALPATHSTPKSDRPSPTNAATSGWQPPPKPHPEPDPARYKQALRVMSEVKKLFLSHINKASNVSFPYTPSEFPWRIDWDKQQTYCRSVWNALTTEREQRLRFFEEPTASVYRDGEEAYRKAWKGLKFERGCFDEFPFGSMAHHWSDRDHDLYDHSPDWIVELWPELNSLKTGRLFLGNSRLIYAREPDAQGHRCNVTTKGEGYRADVFGPAPYAEGGIEKFFVLVDGKPLVLHFGIYVPEMDFSGIETNTRWPGHQEMEASYFAWFGKRRGRVGQGFVAVDSHQTNLYHSLALESNGYRETQSGIVPISEGTEAKTLDFAFDVDYEQFVCVINFDLNETR